MNQFKKIFRAVTASLPHGLLARNAHVPLLLPYHHVVSDEELPHIKNLYAYKNTAQFTKDLEWLLSYYKPIHPDDVARAVLSGTPLPAKSFLLTFDDGFREIADAIAPILSRKGVPALFFINPAFIDNKELFYRCHLSLVLERMKNNEALMRHVASYFGKEQPSWAAIRRSVLGIGYTERHRTDELSAMAGIDATAFLREQRPFLTTEQLLALKAQGFSFGGHSMDHPHFKDLGLEEQWEQTIDSSEFAARFSTSPFRYFAFPHQDQDVSQAFFDHMKTKCPSCLMFGVQNQKTEQNNRVLHRFNAENPSLALSCMAKSILAYNAISRVFGHASVQRK